MRQQGRRHLNRLHLLIRGQLEGRNCQTYQLCPFRSSGFSDGFSFNTKHKIVPWASKKIKLNKRKPSDLSKSPAASKTILRKLNKTVAPLPLTDSVLCQLWAQPTVPFRGQLILPGRETVEDGGRTPLHEMKYVPSACPHYYTETDTVLLEAWETQSTSLWERRLTVEKPPSREISYLDSH